HWEKHQRQEKRREQVDPHPALPEGRSAAKDEADTEHEGSSEDAASIQAIGSEKSGDPYGRKFLLRGTVANSFGRSIALQRIVVLQTVEDDASNERRQQRKAFANGSEESNDERFAPRLHPHDEHDGHRQIHDCGCKQMSPCAYQRE